MEILWHFTICIVYFNNVKGSNKLIIKDISKDAFLMLLRHFYKPHNSVFSKTIEMNVEELSMELLNIADKYQIHSLLEVFNVYSKTFVTPLTT